MNFYGTDHLDRHRRRDLRRLCPATDTTNGARLIVGELFASEVVLGAATFVGLALTTVAILRDLGPRLESHERDSMPGGVTWT